MAARERRVREEEKAVAQGAHRVLPVLPVAVREEGQRAGRGGWASEGKAAPGGGEGNRGSRGCAAARQPNPEADADRYRLGAATAAASCAAAGAEGARDGPEVEG